MQFLKDSGVLFECNLVPIPSRSIDFLVDLAVILIICDGKGRCSTHACVLGVSF